MYAIVVDRGKQIKVKKGEIVLIDKTNAEKGAEIAFDKIAFFSDKDHSVIEPADLEKVVVKAQVLGEEKGEKVKIMKMRKRKRYRRKTGHRQKYTRVRITEISLKS
jgi:large subunit ribosomal protein L21